MLLNPIVEPEGEIHHNEAVAERAARNGQSVPFSHHEVLTKELSYPSNLKLLLL